VLAGLALLVLIAIVAAVGRAHHAPGSHAGGHPPPAAVGDYVFSIIAVILLAGALVTLYVLLANPGLLPERRSKRRNGIVTLIAFALFATLFGQAHGVFNRMNPATNPAQLKPPRAPPQKATTRPGERTAELRWTPVLLVTGAAFAVLGVVALRSARRRRGHFLRELELEAEFEQLVDETLADLRAEADPRRAIIKAYARVEALFASYGLARRRSEAPLEYLSRVLPEVQASASALRRLTMLFQWAKFSAHDVDPSMREEAIDALVEVRDELRSNRAGAAA